MFLCILALLVPKIGLIYDKYIIYSKITAFILLLYQMSHHETYCFKANIAKYIQSKKRTSDLIKYLSELYNKVNNSESIIRLITKMISNTRNPLK